ncbi:DUF7257 domain-containing protein [Mycolicibacterium fortuitum]|uniref:DUF7257 domain-containing protein n=1 Tax=Mycolicibacterium fortuitum TaxID=1766 RepID=UPI001AEF9C2F|nr:hypothetical protein [Mycolicibacterium fortuitum]MBP3086973.1 hypothetical protein [Mycolicibacterium fortuitum]
MITRTSGPVQRIVHNGADIQQVWRNGVLLWSRAGIRVNFDGPDAATLAPDWTDYGPSSTYKAGIVDGQCRLALPDGLVSSPLLSSHQRYNVATAPNDDYELEFRVGTQGSGPSITGDLSRTLVFARVSNGSFTHGVGVQLDSSTLRIVRRVLSINTVMFSGGTFGAGDVINLKGVGNLHTLRRNGSKVGEWNDSTGTAAKGAGYRSLGVVVMASKDLLGPRRFGPTIDWVQLS